MKIYRGEGLSFKPDNQAGERIDKFLATKIDALSRSKVNHLIKTGAVKVNQEAVKPSYQLQSDDSITVVIPDAEPLPVTAEPIPLQIIYEDEYYLAVNKPAGMVVHPGAGHHRGTLVNALKHYTRQLSAVGGDWRPGIVHRLDKETSGIVMCAKSDEAHWKLSQLFSRRQVDKVYRTFVWGQLSPDSGLIDKPIGRSRRNRKKFTVTLQGKSARTRYATIADYSLISYLNLMLETGRTHQIRVHLSSLGHPVLGDSDYGKDRSFVQSLNQSKQQLAGQILARVERQLLHAYQVSFQHPFSRETIEITADLPDDFKQVKALLESEPGAD